MTAARDPSVDAHYEALLAERYTWMMGGPAACFANAKALLDFAGISPDATTASEEARGVALDLGAGAGYHARALAERGFGVVAVDTSAALLGELTEVCADFGVAPVQGDILDDRLYRSQSPFSLILCVGDTLTHIESHDAVNRLIEIAANLLAPGGALLLQFREQPPVLRPQDSVFTVRSERDRIMECVLHDEPYRVWVTDVVHEWTGQMWRSIRSTYPKLRLAPGDLIAQAAAARLTLHLNDTHARQRVLVFKR